MSRVVVYGAGGTGKRLIPILEKKWEICCFCDSDEKMGGGNRQI